MGDVVGNESVEPKARRKGSQNSNFWHFFLRALGSTLLFPTTSPIHHLLLRVSPFLTPFHSRSK